MPAESNSMICVMPQIILLPFLHTLFLLNLYTYIRKRDSRLLIFAYSCVEMEKLWYIIPSIKVSFMWFWWVLVPNSSMGNILCFYHFPARSQKYSVKCQISHFWEIVLMYLPDAIESFGIISNENKDLKLQIIQLMMWNCLQNIFNSNISTDKLNFHI